MILLNTEQEFVKNKAVEWYYNGKNQVFEYDGLPGTGKSVTLMEIVRTLGLDP